MTQRPTMTQRPIIIQRSAMTQRRTVIQRRAVPHAAIVLALSVSASTPGAEEPVLRRSEVVFMYASTPEAYKAYRATFVAWGGAETAEQVQIHRALGIRCTGSVWCLTAGAKALHGDPRLREAVAVDIEGKPIAVPWLFDHVYEGQNTLFGNTNHPAFREHVVANVRRAMAGGADGLHVDDHLGVASPALWYGGGFDEHSIAGFRKYLARGAPQAELAAAGVKDLDSFDYRELVRRVAATAADVKRKEREIPLFDLWKAYHLEAAADFIEELRGVAAEAAGHPVLLSANACLGAEAHHHVVPRLTHVVCEVWFDADRGTKSLDGALRAFAAADRLGRPLACTASGHDWAYVKAHGAAELPRFWIALTYAHGHRFMVPHPTQQWCFDEKLGTHWYRAPVEEFAPLYRFVRANASLLDGFAAAGDVRIEAPPGLICKARRRGSSLAVHVVNTDYDPERGLVREAKDVRIEIRDARIRGARGATGTSGTSGPGRAGRPAGASKPREAGSPGQAGAQGEAGISTQAGGEGDAGSSGEAGSRGDTAGRSDSSRAGSPRARLLRYDAEPVELPLEIATDTPGEAAIIKLPAVRLWSLVAIE